MSPGSVAVVATCAWAALATLFTLGSLVGARRLWAQARARLPPPAWPPIAILRPCEGAELGLEDNLLSSVTARYDGPRAVYFCVPSRDNAAFPIAERACAQALRRAPQVPCQVLVTDIRTRANRKAAQLAFATSQLGLATAAPGNPTVVVSADSDVRLDDGSLPALVVALLEDDRIGAVSAPPVELPANPSHATRADRFSSTLLSSSQQSFLALSGLAHLGGGIPQVGGALLALRTEVLPLIDGFRALEPYLGEDFELTLRLYGHGWRVATAGTIARCFDGGRSFGDVIRRFARWSLVVRRQRPALFPTYFLLLGCTPLVVAAALGLALLGVPGARWALTAAAALVGARTALALLLRRVAELPGGLLRALAAFLSAETLLLAAAALALGSTRIVWRGRHYIVGRRGALLDAK